MIESREPGPGLMERLERNRKRAEHVALHYGLAFFVANGTRYEYRGWKSEERDATEEEIELWGIIDGFVPEEG